MTYSIMEAVRTSCAFVIRVEMPLTTVTAILELLVARKITIEALQMQVIGGGEAIFILHGRIEKDRIKHVRHSLEKINGVLAIESLETKGGHIS